MFNEKNMNTEKKYDPEDIESLLMYKQFHELYEEERNFVLQHVEGEEEYESLRKTLHELHNVAQEEMMLEPDPELKRELMLEFARERKKGFWIWLNSLFAMPEIKWYRQPGFKYALATCCVVVALFLVFRNNDEVVTAENITAPQPLQEDSTSANGESKRPGNDLFAENLTVKEYPPAPKVMAPEIRTFKATEPVMSMDANADSAPVEDVRVMKDEADNIEVEEEAMAAEKSVEMKKLPAAADKKNMDDDMVDNMNLETKSTVVTSPSYTMSTPASGSGAYLFTPAESAFAVVMPVVSRPVNDVKDVLAVLYTAH